MAEKKIGARIVIDGESEFRANLNSAKKALGAFESELDLVTSQYKENENSLEALTAKQQAYIKIQEEQKNKVQLLSDMQQKALDKYAEEQRALEECGAKRERLTKELEEAKLKYGENSDEVKALSEELQQANKEYDTQEKALQKLGDKVNTYQKDLNNAQTELNSLNNEISQNEKYMQEAEKSVDGCATSIDEYGNEIDDAKEKTSVFADVLKAELAAEAIKTGLKTILEGIKSIATAATNVGSSFESSMSQVAATMGITTQEIKEGSKEYDILSKAAQDCGKATMYSASQAAEALNYLALAGYDAEKAAAVLPKVLNLAAAGGLDLAYASDLVTDSMAALGMETSELDNYIDEMAKTSQKSNTSVAQLGEATLVCAGTVTLAGQSLETMNAELGVLANNGIKGAEGGTHLRNILLSLSAPTDTASVAIQKLGLQIEDSSGNMRDLNDIMIDMNKAMSSMSSTEKTQMISQIFNKTDISAVNALLKGTNGEYADLLGKIKDCSGAAQNMADTMNDNLKGKITILQSALEGLGITAYNLFDDEMKDAVDAATESVGNLQDAIDNGDLGVSLDNMSKALGDFAEEAIGVGEDAIPKLIDGLTWILENADMIATLIGGVTAAKITYTAATKAATIAQELFNITANANPYILLATAIGGAAAAIGIYCATADDVSGMSESTDKLVEASKKLNSETANATAGRATSRAALDAEGEASRKLVEELDDLQKKTELTTSEQAKMQSIVDQLNENYPDLNLAIDEHSSMINKDTEEILANIDAILQQSKVEAAKEDLTEIAKQQYEVEKQMAELKNEETAAVERLKDAEAALNEERERGGGNVRYSDEAQAAYAQATLDIENLRTQMSETQGTIDSLGTEYEETMQYIADNDAVSQAANKMGELGNAANDAGSSMYEMSAEAQKAYSEMYKSVSETIQKQINLFAEFNGAAELSTSQLLANMQSQVDGVTKWSNNLQELADRGINQGLLQYLAELGPEGAGYVATFVQMTDEELQKANALYTESLLLPSDTTSQIMENWKNAGEMFTQGMADGIAEQTETVTDTTEQLGSDALDSLATVLDEHSPSRETLDMGVNFVTGMENGITQEKPMLILTVNNLATEVLKTAQQQLDKTKFVTIGRQITAGLADGIRQGKSEVISAIQEVCAAAIAEAKAKLQIHSPSKAFAYLGEMSGQGYIEGWRETMSDINGTIRETMTDAQQVDVTNITSGTNEQETRSYEIQQQINIYSQTDDLVETARKFRESQREAAEAW